MRGFAAPHLLRWCCLGHMVSCRSFAKALAATPSDRAKIALVEELAGAAALVARSVCYVRAARRCGYEDSAHLLLFAYIPFFLLFAAGVGGLSTGRCTTLGSQR